ncbi:MAG: preprotein translocase subunit YajC [Anaerovoracaceae bacterium]|jgi:preprotein translocase subunit YajC
MGSYGGIILLIVMIAVMYLLLIRPQRKKEKETKAMRDAVRVGDEIITIGGICGKVVKTKEESLVIQVGAGKTKFEVMRWSISKVVTEGSRASSVDEKEEHEEAPKKAAPKRIKRIDAEENDNEAEAEADEAEAEAGEEK